MSVQREKNCQQEHKTDLRGGFIYLSYFLLGAILIFHLQIVILIICEPKLLLKM